MILKLGKNIRLFENKWLEHFTHVHPFLPIAIWGPIIIACFFLPVQKLNLSLTKAFGMAILGFLLWTLVEYLLHRFVFHFQPKTAWQKRLVFLFHGVHHEDPKDQHRLWLK